MTTEAKQAPPVPAEELTITAHLFPYARGCDYSGHFRVFWQANDNIHPDVKAVKVQTQHAINKAMVIVRRGETELLIMRESEIDLWKLQEFLLEEINKNGL